MLEIQHLYAGYEPDHWVLRDVSFSLKVGDRIAILGQNGAGKSTLAKVLMGCMTHTKGTVCLDGQDLTNLPTHQRTRKGLAWCMQENNVFPQLTVQENLQIASLALPLETKKERYEWLYTHIEILKNTSRTTLRATYLSGGERQQVALAMALLSTPTMRCLILDEISAGLSPDNITKITYMLENLLAEQSISLVLIEQNQYMAKQICSHSLTL